ncbi:MAG: AraC family transcriptional regulator [Bacillota bacterium]|nr:AraC family transcriptional regulator [Bacillota bacterium]
MKTTDDFKRVFDTDCSFSHPVDDSYTMNAFHFHNVFEIYFAHTGGLTYFVENRIYPVEKNDLFVFSHLDLHRIGIAPQTRYERSIVVFNPEYVSSLCTDTTDLLACFLDRKPNFSHRLHLSDEQAEMYQVLFQKARHHGNHKRYGEDVRQKMALIDILLFINPLYQGNPEWVSSQADAGYNKVRPIISYINENIGHKLSLDELSERFYIDKYYLCKLFKETTGFTIHEYGMYRRIIRATELLRKNHQVAQVAEMTGFQNDGHFITTFKKHVGITPKQYALRQSGL